MSKFILFAFHIHQITVKYTCPFHYISWNANLQQWKFEPIGFHRMWPYYLMLISNIFCIILYIASLATIRLRSNDFGNDPLLLYTSGLYVLTILLTLVADYLFLTNGNEWVSINNYLLPQAPQPTTKESINANFRKLRWSGKKSTRKLLQVTKGTKISFISKKCFCFQAMHIIDIIFIS